MSAGSHVAPIRRLTLLVALFASLGPSSSRAAGGIDLSWADCGSFGAAAKTFACDREGERLVIVGSAIAGVTMPQLNGQYSILELQSNASTLPAWWQLSTSGCRATSPSSITSDFDFTSGGSCADPWQGSAMGGIDYQSGFGGSNRARIRTICAIATPTAISATEEYSFFKIRISTNRTTGPSGCTGCNEGACIVFDSIQLTQPAGVGDVTITDSILRNSVQWQSAGPSGGAGICPGASLQTVKTWGGVKQMYHSAR